jgi:Na+-transporting NADH:ubiquinone oxidoreductase subunit NqrE
MPLRIGLYIYATYNLNITLAIFLLCCSFCFIGIKVIMKEQVTTQVKIMIIMTWSVTTNNCLVQLYMVGTTKRCFSELKRWKSVLKEFQNCITISDRNCEKIQFVSIRNNGAKL